MYHFRPVEECVETVEERVEPRAACSGSAEGIEQVDVGDGEGGAGADDGDVVVLAEAGHGEAVEEGDGGGAGNGGLLAGAREHLAGGEDPAGGGGAVVVERAAQVGDALAADLAAVAADDDGELELVGGGRAQHAGEVRLAAGHAGAAEGAELADADLLEREHADLDEGVARQLAQLA